MPLDAAKTKGRPRTTRCFDYAVDDSASAGSAEAKQVSYMISARSSTACTTSPWSAESREHSRAQAAPGRSRAGGVSPVAAVRTMQSPFSCSLSLDRWLKAGAPAGMPAPPFRGRSGLSGAGSSATSRKDARLLHSVREERLLQGELQGPA